MSQRARHAQPSDTSGAAARVLTKLLRAATPAQNFAVMRSLSENAAWHAWRTVAENHPGADEDELLVQFVTTYYGQKLGDSLRAHFQSRQRVDA